MSQPDLCGSAAEFVFLLFSGHEALAGIIYLLLLHYNYRMYHEFIYSPSLHYTSEYECESLPQGFGYETSPGMARAFGDFGSTTAPGKRLV